ncbi:unnamed protein product [Ectocarpus sp. 13 AM-2016]
MDAQRNADTRRNTCKTTKKLSNRDNTGNKYERTHKHERALTTKPSPLGDGYPGVALGSDAAGTVRWKRQAKLSARRTDDATPISHQRRSCNSSLSRPKQLRGTLHGSGYPSKAYIANAAVFCRFCFAIVPLVGQGNLKRDTLEQATRLKLPFHRRKSDTSNKRTELYRREVHRPIETNKNKQ